MYPRYSLTLMLTHQCNLRCTYCYVGQKHDRTMPLDMARKAIDRAVASLQPAGVLELGFFGGEPLLLPEMIQALIDYAIAQTASINGTAQFSITTNGTQTSPAAWQIMTRRDVGLTISCDGLPAVHDQHRRHLDGSGSSAQVHDTIRRLLATGMDVRVNMVLGPHTMQHALAGAQLLRDMGVKHIEMALDLWSRWNEADEAALSRTIAQLADFWRQGIPHVSMGWFDEKAAHLAKLPFPPIARCGFGDGAIAVAPSGHLYPCERLIGEDRDDNPMRIPGDVMDGPDFRRPAITGRRDHAACNSCAMDSMCNTWCRCSNYVRSGDPRRPDSLLCTLNQVCLAETARVLGDALKPAPQPAAPPVCRPLAGVPVVSEDRWKKGKRP